MGNKGAKVLTLFNDKFNILLLSTFVVHAKHKCHKVNMCLKLCFIHKEGVKNLSRIAQLCTSKHRTTSMCENTLQHEYWNLFKVKLINHVN